MGYSLLSRSIMGALALVYFATAHACPSDSNSIGLFFDPHGISNCVSDTINYPSFCEAYLTVSNISGGDSILAWEAAVCYDSNLSLLGYELFGNATNYGVFPGCQVACNVPVDSMGVALLAKYTFMASGPSEIHIHDVDGSLVGSPMLPSITCSLGSPIDVNYAFGSPLHPVATVGLSVCPDSCIAQEEYMPEEPEWNPVDVTTIDECYIVTSGSSESKDSVSAITGAAYYCELAFIGNIVSTELYRTVTEGDWRVAGATMAVDVDSTLWGPDKDSWVIYCEGVSWPGYVIYPERCSDHIVPGAACLILATYKDGSMYTYPHLVIPDNVKADAIKESLKAFQSCVSFGEDDAVVLAQRIVNDPRHYTIVSLYKGREMAVGGEFELGVSANMIAASPIADYDRLLMRLRQKEDGTYELVRGVLSCFAQTESGMVSIKGMPYDYYDIFGGEQ